MLALIDAQSFYCSCQEIFEPKLRDKPVVVLSANDGAVIARSKVAKALNIRMSEPYFKIKKKVEQYDIAVYSLNLELVGDLSSRLMNVLAELVPRIEVYSIDEAFLDLSIIPAHELEAYVTDLRKTVKQWTGIPTSIGVGPNKSLAKVANKIAKKGDGVCLLNTEEKIEHALKSLEIEDVWGIGSKYATLLRKHHITNAWQLREANLDWVGQELTVVGKRLVYELRGKSCLPLELVVPAKKSICCSQSFGDKVSDLETLKEALAHFTARAVEKLRNQQSAAKLLTVFISTNRFKKKEPQYYNSQTVSLPVSTAHLGQIQAYAMAALVRLYKSGFSFKKAGIILTGIVPNNQIQQRLFDGKDHQKIEKLMQAVDKVNNKMGRDTLRTAAQGFPKAGTLWLPKREMLSPCYTTRWDQLWTIKI